MSDWHETDTTCPDPAAGGSAPAEKVSNPLRILCYVSGHGYGHAVRTSTLLSELEKRFDTRILVRTDAPAFLFEQLHSGVLAAGRCDIGLIQLDGLSFDLDRTLAAWESLLADWDIAVEAEMPHIQSFRPDLLLADIPPLGFAVARRAGLPGIGLGNFSWDWIYENYLDSHPRFEPIIAHIRKQYAAAELLLRLPFHGDMSAFPRILDIPIFGSPSPRSQAEVRAQLDLPEGPVALISFGRYGVEQLDLERLGNRNPEVYFLLPCEGEAPFPPNVRSVPRETLPHRDLIQAADVVLSKPGYGIVTDCLLAGRPILYTDRGDFREYPLLAKAIETQLGGAFISRQRLARGDLTPELTTLLERGPLPQQTFQAEGADRASQAIQALAV